MNLTWWLSAIGFGTVLGIGVLAVLYLAGVIEVEIEVKREDE